MANEKHNVILNYNYDKLMKTKKKENNSFKVTNWNIVIIRRHTCGVYLGMCSIKMVTPILMY